MSQDEVQESFSGDGWEFSVGSPRRSEAKYPRPVAEASLFSATRPRGGAPHVTREVMLRDGRYIRQRGPLLTYDHDEEVLIAIIQLCTNHTLQNKGDHELKRLIDNMSIDQRSRYLMPLSDEKSLDVSSARVPHSRIEGRMNIYAIANYLNETWGGKTRAKISKSLERLSLNAFDIRSPLGGTKEKVQLNVPLLQIEYVMDNGVPDPYFTVIFSDEILGLFESYMTMNLDLRSQLSHSGKALHSLLTTAGFPSSDKPLTLSFSELSESLRMTMRHKAYREKSEADDYPIMKKYNFIGGWTFDMDTIKPYSITFLPPN